MERLFLKRFFLELFALSAVITNTVNNYKQKQETIDTKLSLFAKSLCSKITFFENLFIIGSSMNINK